MARNQVYHFSQVSIRVLTNLDLSITSVVCQIFFEGELIAESKAGECLQLHNTREVYCFTEDFLEKLDAATEDYYGRFTLLFSEEGQILDQTTLVLMPELDVQLSNPEPLLPEDAMIEVKVFSPNLPVWDPTTAQTSFSATLQLRPRLSAQPSMVGSLTNEIVCLVSQIVTALLIFPSIHEAVEINIHPKLFGIRLYQRGRKSGGDDQLYSRYWQVDELDYYALETVALYVFTEAYCKITLRAGQLEIWSGQANSEGHLLIEGLGFLKPYCKDERVSITVTSKDLEREFFIRWTPLIHKMTIKEGQINLCVSGPRNTGIILRFVELNEVIRIQQWVTCEGENLEVSLDLPSVETNSQFYYLTPMYCLTDGTLLPVAQQWCIKVSNDTGTIPEDWLRVGIGVPSETIF